MRKNSVQESIFYERNKEFLDGKFKDYVTVVDGLITTKVPDFERTVYLDEYGKFCIKIHISEKNDIFRQMIMESSKNYNAMHKNLNNDNETYNRGVMSPAHDPTRSVRVGLMGEAAFACVAGVPMNIGYLSKGDDFDFDLGDGLRIDVKTSMRVGRKFFITDSDAYDRVYEKKSNLFVFMQTDALDGVHMGYLEGVCGINIFMRGFLPLESVNKMFPELAKKGKWKNKVPSVDKIRRIEKLLYTLCEKSSVVDRNRIGSVLLKCRNDIQRNMRPISSFDFCGNANEKQDLEFEAAGMNL